MGSGSSLEGSMWIIPSLPRDRHYVKIRQSNNLRHPGTPYSEWCQLLTLLENLGAREEKTLDNRNAAVSAHNQWNGNNDSKTNKTTIRVHEAEISPGANTENNRGLRESWGGERLGSWETSKQHCGAHQLSPLLKWGDLAEVPALIFEKPVGLKFQKCHSRMQ